MVELRKILWPSDFSHHSKRALAVAVAVARAYGATLTALHVRPREGFGGFASVAPLLHDDDAVGIRTALWLWMRAARAAEVGTEIVVREGDPRLEVVTFASLLPADLVVMGTHGRQGSRPDVLGSVTEAALARGACPVLAVPPEGPLAETGRLFSTVLWATDFSPTAVAAGAYAASFASARRARLLLMHVTADPERDASPRLHLVADDALRARCEVQPIVRAGTPHAEIVNAARQNRADLIVLGSPGSTCLQVLRAAPCPILAVPAGVEIA